MGVAYRRKAPIGDLKKPPPEIISTDEASSREKLEL
jgi:hypothetical protein